MRKVMEIADIRWDRYPAVAEHAMARRWIENQVLLGMAPNLGAKSNLQRRVGAAVSDSVSFSAHPGHGWHSSFHRAIPRKLGVVAARRLALRRPVLLHNRPRRP